MGVGVGAYEMTATNVNSFSARSSRYLSCSDFNHKYSKDDKYFNRFVILSRHSSMISQGTQFQ